MNPKNAEAILKSKLAIFDAEQSIENLKKAIADIEEAKERAEKRHTILIELIGKIGEISETLRPFAFVDADFCPDQPRIRIIAPGLTEIRYLSHMSPSAQWYYAYRDGDTNSGACCGSLDEALIEARRHAQDEARPESAGIDMPF